MKKLFYVLPVLFFILMKGFMGQSIPVVNFSIEVKEQYAEVTYDLIDPDNVIMNNDVYHPTIAIREPDEEEIVKEVEIEEGLNNYVRIDELQIGHNYVMDVNVPYDFSDSGVPTNEKPYTIASKNFKTLKPVPIGLIFDTSYATASKLFVETSIIDGYGTVVGPPRLDLYLDDELVQAGIMDGKNYVFENLESNKTYHVVFSIDYDVDSDGVIDGTTVLDKTDFTTDAENNVPIVNFNESNIDDSSLEFKYDLIDNDNVLIQDTSIINLYDPNMNLLKSLPAEVGTNNSILFENLTKGVHYIEILGEYELGGVQKFEYTNRYTMGIYDTTGTISAEPNFESIKVNYEIYDAPVLDPIKLELYKGEELVKEVSPAPKSYLFSDLVPDTNYEIILSSGDNVLDTLKMSTLEEDVNYIKVCKDLESIGRGKNYPYASHDDAWEYSDDYALAYDIDCSDTRNVEMYGEDGFDSIGNWIEGEYIEYDVKNIESFSGNFFGNGYDISNLYINSYSYVGLFKVIEKGGLVSNLGIKNSEINGDFYVGSLSSHNFGTVSDFSSDNVILANAYSGEIVGQNNGLILDSYSLGENNGKVTSGGLVGLNQGEILNSYSSSDISGEFNLGGISGENSGDIIDSYFTGVVDTSIDSADDTVGGIAGLNYGNIENTFSTGASAGASLVGEQGSKSSIKNSFATGASKYGPIKDLDGSASVSNVFHYDGASCSACSDDFETVTTEELNDSSWYKEYNFDEKFDLSYVGDGYYPHVLKSHQDVEVESQLDIELPQF